MRRAAAAVLTLALLLSLLVALRCVAPSRPLPIAVGDAGGRIEAVYINLDRREDRRRGFERDWARSDLRDVQLHRFSAVDGAKAASALDSRLISAQGLADLQRAAATSERDTHFQLTPGAVGCFSATQGSGRGSRRAATSTSCGSSRTTSASPGTWAARWWSSGRCRPTTTWCSSVSCAPGATRRPCGGASTAPGSSTCCTP